MMPMLTTMSGSASAWTRLTNKAFSVGGRVVKNRNGDTNETCPRLSGAVLGGNPPQRYSAPPSWEGKVAQVEELARRAAVKKRKLTEAVEQLVAEGGHHLVDAEGMAGLELRLMESLWTTDDLAMVRVNASLSALDFAKMLRMPGAGLVAPSIVWEYANLVNNSLKKSGISGWCVTEAFREELMPKKLDWIAVACCEAKVGVLLNRVEKMVTVYNYEHADEGTMSEIVRVLLEKVQFPKSLW